MTTTTRFAPSPTGHIHVGNLRTALMNWLIARKAGGTFILRLDDTDQERSRQEYADGIMRDLEWLGLTWDRVERQSDRLDRYAAAADGLRGKGRLYEVFETPTELDLKRKKQLNMGKPPVYDRAGLDLGDDQKAALRAEGREGYWRFLLDHERIEWTDGIIGDVSIDAASVSDPVLIRADGQVLYTFASSVDDVDMWRRSLRWGVCRAGQSPCSGTRSAEWAARACYGVDPIQLDTMYAVNVSVSLHIRLSAVQYDGTATL